ncbi:MAG: hypothetical protein IPO88_28880 [Nannocystis sp.]|uniref:hypothetical protein n=1 Tax=Nannocystis sp. TaxID=1962667 RepID=UPI002426F3B9|nr:hypothetical protein [Nannocystis sp.]MBK9757445.1 hypothetical protein [Nannocystis sp.]
MSFQSRTLPSLAILTLLHAGAAVAAPPPESPWGFERCDLQGWSATGTAFSNQPTVGNTVAARRPGTSPGQLGRCWVGTYEGDNGDAPTGTLLSDPFVVTVPEISFLVGGGNDLQRLRVELLVRVAPGEQPLAPAILSLGARVTLPDGEYVVVRAVTGRNDETMIRQVFDTPTYIGRTARLRVVDNASGPWGHINVDDFFFGPVGDLVVTGMEVTQAIQVPDNRIPLIGGKRTLVRVYIRGVEDSRGRWDAVTGTLAVRNVGGGSAGERVLGPITNNSSSTISVTPLPGDRNMVTGSLNFLLDFDQTTPGERDLEVRVSSVTQRAEQSLTNNVLARRVRFAANQALWFYGATYASTSATNPLGNQAAPPFSDFNEHVDYTRSLFPVSSATVVPAYMLGSPPTFDWADDSAHAREAYQWAVNTVARLPQGPEHGLYMLMPDARCGCGVEYGGLNVMFGHNVRGGQGGEVMAHEVAHFYGLLHVHDSNVMSADHQNDGPTWEDHPYAHAAIGPNPGLRTYAARSFQIVPATWNGGHTHDIMSYARPQWVSPHTYCRLIDRTTNGALRCPDGAERAELRRPAPASTMLGFVAPPPGMWALQAPPVERPWLLVRGTLRGDKASFAPFEQIFRREDLRSTSQGKRYSLTLADSGGAALLRHDFDVVAHDAKPGAPQPFAVIVPYDPATAKIVLRSKNKPIAERIVSASAPQIDGLTFDPKLAASGSAPLTWTAKDSDGDTLVHSIEYSPDGGDSWRPVAVAQSQPKLAVDLRDLPGGDAAVLRVLSSDGVRTTEARTPSFVVARKPPRVNLDAPSEITAPGAKPIALTSASPLVLAGTAYDLEDGPITATSAFRWRSDRDGELGQGPWIVLRKLSPGKHRITLRTIDSHKQSAEAAVTLTVQGPPAK